MPLFELWFRIPPTYRYIFYMFSLNMSQSLFVLLSVLHRLARFIFSEKWSDIATSEQIFLYINKDNINKDIACQSVLHISFCSLV